MSDKSSTKRRAVIKGMGGLLGGGIATTYLISSSDSALAASFTANADSITTPDGTITDVTLNPDITLSWQGLDTAPTQADITVKVESTELSTNVETMYNKVGRAIDTANQTGSDSQNFASAFSEKSVPGNHTGIAVSDFEESNDGTSNDTTMTIHVEANVQDSSGNILASTATSADYTVTVTNETSSVSASGTGGGNVTA